MSSDLRESLKGCIDKSLGIRDDIGATIHKVYFVTRTWSGEDIGDGTETVVRTLMAPSPNIVDYGMDKRLRTGSNIRQGDLILTGISGNLYSYSDLHTQTQNRTIEKFYEVNSEYYEVIHIKEKFVTWEVHIRKTNEKDIRTL